MNITSSVEMEKSNASLDKSKTQSIVASQSRITSLIKSMVKKQLTNQQDSEILKLMNPAAESQAQFYEFLEKLQININRTLETQERVLEKRYQSIFGGLDRAVSNLQKYKESLKGLKDSINTNDETNHALEDVDNFKSYSTQLQNDIVHLEAQIALQSKMIKKLKIVQKYKHSELNKKNQANLVLLRDLNQKRKYKERKLQINQNSPKRLQENDRQLLQSEFIVQKQDLIQFDEDQQKILQEIDWYKQNNKLLRHRLQQQENNFHQQVALFQECQNIFRKQLEKSQKVVSSQKGLNGSLLFEMKKAELFQTQEEILARQQNRGPKPMLAGREVRTLVHETLKGMLESKEGKRVQYLKDFDISWEQFKNFNATQMLGVMSLKPKVFEKILQIFEKKGKNIKDQIQYSMNYQ